MPRLLTASEIHQKRVAEGLVDFNPGQGDTTTIAARDPRQKTGRYITSKEQHEARLLEKAREDAARVSRDASEPTPAFLLDELSAGLDEARKLKRSLDQKKAETDRLQNELFDLKSQQIEAEQSDVATDVLERGKTLAIIRESLPLMEKALKTAKAEQQRVVSMLDHCAEQMIFPAGQLLAMLRRDRLEQLTMDAGTALSEIVGSFNSRNLETLVTESVAMKKFDVHIPHSANLDAWSSTIASLKNLVESQPKSSHAQA